MVAVTPLYAAPLALLLVGLTLRVIQLRWRYRIALGDGEERQLLKAVRAHGNAAETIPLALVLLLVAELAGVGSTALHTAGALLVVGRFLHAFGLSRRSGPSFGRTVGMVLTIITIGTLAVAVFTAVL